MGTETMLDTVERGELEKNEQVIRKGMQTFVEVGKALANIRDRNLYREQYKSFEKYCEQRWGFKRHRAYQLIKESGVVENVEESSTKSGPAKSEQARPLAKLPDEEQAEAWEEAQEEAGDKEPTGKQVERVVARRRGEQTEQAEQGEPETAPEPEAEPEAEEEAPADPLDEMVSEIDAIKSDLRAVQKRMRDSFGFQKDKSTGEYQTNGLHRYTYSSTCGQINAMIRHLEDEKPTGYDENGGIRTKRRDKIQEAASS